jgi:ELWxxDGT repeat protein
VETQTLENSTASRRTSRGFPTGPTPGPLLLKDILPGLTGGAPNSSFPKNFTMVAASDAFTVFPRRATAPGESTKTRGTASSTVLVKPILSGNPAPSNNNILEALDLLKMRQANGPPLLQRDDGVHGRELWRSDGTAVGTGRVFAINTTLDPQGSYAVQSLFGAATLWGTAYFAGWDVNSGLRALVDERDPGRHAAPQAYQPGRHQLRAPAIRDGGIEVIVASSEASGLELWASDGTANATQLVKDTNPGKAGSNTRAGLRRSEGWCSSAPTTARRARSSGVATAPPPGPSRWET